MLHSNTNLLINYLKTDAPDYAIVSSYVYTIRRLGTQEDVSTLMEYYHQNPTTNHVGYILTLLYDFGTLSDAKELWKHSFKNGVLKSGHPEEVLHILGYLGLEESRDVLLRYALNSNDHSLNQNAVLGLIHLDCSNHQSELNKEIEGCYGKSLFSEFSPSLVCKVSDQYDILSHFYKLGSSIVSTDCNGGIVLAFSLCGDTGKDFFWRVLWDENWECLGGGTGTDYWTYIAMQNLGISFLDLYNIIRETKTKGALEYRLKVFKSLIRYRIIDAPHPIQFIKTSRVSFLDLYKILYGWVDKYISDNIMDLARKVNLDSDFYRLKILLEFKVREEMFYS